MCVAENDDGDINGSGIAVVVLVAMAILALDIMNTPKEHHVHNDIQVKQTMLICQKETRA